MIDTMKTPYYLFDADGFIQNYKDLCNAFRSIYPKYQVGYSFKTNYTPAVCELVKEMGGFAEVVSDMEYLLAKKVGYQDNQIIYNGPGKGEYLAQCLLGHGMLNVDNLSEFQKVCVIAKSHPETQFSIGLRVNFDIGNNLHSRFGIDIAGEDFQEILSAVNATANLSVVGLHFHISRARGLDSWRNRIVGILEIAEKYFQSRLNYIDIGSGMYGRLDPQLQEQFGDTPTYQDYASVVASVMAEHYREYSVEEKPLLITEPGTTLISKYIHLFTTVLDIKTIREKTFALMDCSFHNVGEICELKNIPFWIHSLGQERREYSNTDFVGYTCLEQDVIYRSFNGVLGKGDIVEIGNVGGYSVVLKPPFIHPDIPMYMQQEGIYRCIKRAQTFEDIFTPYSFNGGNVE